MTTEPEELKEIGNAIRNSILSQRVNLDQITALHGVVPKINWNLVAADAVLAIGTILDRTKPVPRWKNR